MVLLIDTFGSVRYCCELDAFFMWVSIVLRERSVEYEGLLDCKIFSWVRRSTLQLGVQGGEREIKRETYELRLQIELYVSI